VNNERFSDIIFLVQGRKIFAHKAILFARSEYFSALVENGLKESSQPQVTIPDIKYPVFLAVLEYL
jgi:hypothetical protein